jgi:hypothetical protein
MWKRPSVLVIILLIIISNFLFLASFDDLSLVGSASGAAPPAIDGATTYWNDNWTVDSDAVYRNQTIIVNGNITVTNGYTLTLINVTIMMNCTLFNGQYHIDVQNGGSMRVLDYDWDNTTTNDASLITDSPYDLDNASVNDYAYNFSVNWGGYLEVRNSSIHDCGWASLNDWQQGISVYGSNSLFDHVNILNRFKGIVVNSAANVVINQCNININATVNDAIGIHVMGAFSVIIRNNTIYMWGTGGNQIGIIISTTTDSFIIENLVTLTSSTGWADGIAIMGGTRNTVSGNIVYQYIDGSSILLWYTDTATVEFNQLTNYAFWASEILSMGSTNCNIQHNDLVLNNNGIGISLQNDCQNTVVYNNFIQGNSNLVEGINVLNAYNNFTISTNYIDLTGINSYGLNCQNSAWFVVYVLNVTISNQFSTGMSFRNCNNATIIGTNITTTPAATDSFGVWVEHSGDIFIVDLIVNIRNAFGAGVELSDGANSSIIAYAYVSTTSATSPALEGDNCSSIIIINSTLDASAADDISLTQNATIYLLNTTYSDRSLFDALTQLIVGWFLNIKVQDEGGQPVPNVNVETALADSTIYHTGQTNSNGELLWLPCIGYIATPGSTDNSTNPHIINATNATCWDEVSVDLTNGGQNVVLTFANDDPVITNPTSNIVVLEDSTLNCDFQAWDHENNPLVWSISPTSDWVSLNSTTGELDLTPDDSDVGDHSFSIRVTDINSGYDEFPVTVRVNNRAPVLQTANVVNTTEDMVYVVDLDTDDDPGTTWMLTPGINWLNINNNGILSGTPDNSHVGIWKINISIEDSNGGITWNNFSLEVENTPPIIHTNHLKTATEDQLYRVDYASSDDNQGRVTWSKVTGPSWLSIHPATGILTGTPTNTHVRQWTVTIKVDDGNGGNSGSTQSTFQLTVENAPPKILNSEIIWAEEDSYYEVDHFSSDDGQGTITWSVSSDTHDWLEIDHTTGILSGTPSNRHVGGAWVNVTVRDDHNGIGWKNFTLTVNNTNDVPVITTTDVLNATEDKPYSVTYQASDEDGDTIIWSITSDATWLDLDTATGELSGTPTNDDVGLWLVTISCADGNGGAASQEFNLSVANVNDAPIIETYLPPGQYPNVQEGVALEFNVTFSDEDSDIFTIVWTLDSISVREDVPFWTYTPEFYTAGDHDVLINISDDGGASVSHRWIVIVTSANRAPKIDEFGPMNLKPILDSETTELSFTINASDPDNDKLTFEWFVDDVDTGERTNSFTFDRSLYGSGTFDVTVRITDSEGTTINQTWTLDAKPLPKKKDDSEYLFIYTILAVIAVVIIVLVFVLVFFVFKKKEKPMDIEDIFLVSTSGILLAHKSKELKPDMDEDILSGMLTAIQDFITDAFTDKTKFGLKRLDFGESEIHIKRGKGFYIAVVHSGEEPDDFEEKLDLAIENIEEKFGEVLDGWTGNQDQVKGIKDELDVLLV